MKYLIVLLIVLMAGCKPMVSKECDYVVTGGYRLVKNNKGRWAISHTGTSSILGYSVRYGHYGFYEYDNRESMTFKDSCSAKGLLKKYLEDKENNRFR